MYVCMYTESVLYYAEIISANDYSSFLPQDVRLQFMSGNRPEALAAFIYPKIDTIHLQTIFQTLLSSGSLSEYIAENNYVRINVINVKLWGWWTVLNGLMNKDLAIYETMVSSSCQRWLLLIKKPKCIRLIFIMLLASQRVELLCNLANKDSWQSKQKYSGQVTRHIELPLGHNLCSLWGYGWFEWIDTWDF